jgi:RND family efflux transporter MFP subunit
MRRIAWLGIIVWSLLWISGCGAAAGSLPAPEPPKVTVATPVARAVRDVDEYTGRIEATKTVDVRARVTGHLQEVFIKGGDYVQEAQPTSGSRLDNSVREGDYVEEGQLLFLIDPRTYQAEYEQAQARVKLYDAKYLYAKSVRVRSERLLASNSVSREEFEQNVAAENEALAARDSAMADTESQRLNLEFTKVRAEIAGRIDRALVTKGNLVQSGPAATLLTRIVSVDPIYVYFNPDELAFLRYTERRVAGEGKFEAQHVRERQIAATIILADGSTYPETGVIDFASNQVDPSTGTIQVRAVFRNEKRALSPGLFVRLRVMAEDAYPALLVPERSINTDQSDKFVYVVDEKSLAQRRNVELGTKQGRLRVIKSGLQPTDKVVISGGLLVRPGEAVQAKDEPIKEEKESSAVTTRYRPLMLPPPGSTNSGLPGQKPHAAVER